MSLRTTTTARWPWVFSVAAAISGVLLSLILWQGRLVAEEKAANETFRVESLALQHSVAQEIQLFVDVLDSIRQLHNISDQISSADFDEFVEKGMLYQRRILGAFGFVQRMDDATRRLLEQPDPKSTSAAFTVVEWDGSGHFRSVKWKDDYFPLTYQNPKLGLGVPNGFDFSMDELSRGAIVRMIATGDPAIGGQKADGSGWYIFSPILYPMLDGEPVLPPGYLVGFAVSVLHPDNILNSVRKNLPSRSLRIDLSSKPESDRALPEAGLYFQSPLRVADQTWTFRCEAGPEYLQSHRTRRPELILAVGLLITFLLTLELLLMARRSRQIENMVRLRTAALTEAKAKLEDEMSQRLKLEKEILEVGSREKLRVGQDLHDSLGQKLTGAVFLSRALAERLASASPEDQESARHINELLKEALSQIRRIARGLAPVELSDEGLVHALQRLAEDIRDVFGIDCTVCAEEPARLPVGSAAVHLYHITQEAANNAARHGEAEQIRITLSPGFLSIEDDGNGIPTEAGRGQGMGLKIMSYRAAMIGGQLDVQRRSDGGTVVTCRF